MKRRNIIANFLTLPFLGCERILGNENAKTHNIINFWALGQEGQYAEILLNDFLKANKNLQVKIQQIPFTSAYQKYLTAHVGEHFPDVAQIGNSWLPQMVEIGAIKSLTPWGGNFDIDDYFSGIWNTNIYKNHLYGVPWYADTRLIFYRDDLVKIPDFPKDWLGFQQMLLTQKSGENSPLFMPQNDVDPFIIFILQNGFSFDFEDDNFQSTLSYYLDFYNKHLADMDAAAKIGNFYDEFARGTFKFFISGPWNISQLQDRQSKSNQFTWANATMPGPNGSGASLAGGASLVVGKNSKDPEKAIELIMYLNQQSVQNQLFKLGGNLPSRKSTWHEFGLFNDKNSAVFYRQLQNILEVPKLPEWERIVREIQIQLEKRISGAISTQEMKVILKNNCAKILEKRRFLIGKNGGLNDQ